MRSTVSNFNIFIIISWMLSFVISVGKFGLVFNIIWNSYTSLILNISNALKYIFVFLVLGH